MQMFDSICHYLLYTKLGGGFKYVLYTSLILGKIPILTNIFQWGLEASPKP